jgi:hypothetical protein
VLAGAGATADLAEEVGVGRLTDDPATAAAALSRSFLTR